MNLSTLLIQIPRQLFLSEQLTKSLNFEIYGIQMDSRRVKPGDLFIALTGEKTDGHEFIKSAIERGAVAVVGSKNIRDISVPYIKTMDGRLALAYLSAAYYGFPARNLTVIGVTGTDGKTTTCTLIYKILQAAGIKAGMITTVNAEFENRVIDTGYHVTTPEAPDLQEYLASMEKLKPQPVTHVVIESTSHGLAQHRVSSCDFDIGVITNVTHEHLDYHKAFKNYREAKARLFRLLAETPEKKQGNIRLAILNRDDPSYNYFKNLLDGLFPKIHQVSYGLHNNADLRGEKIGLNKGLLSFHVISNKYSFPVTTNLLGEYNAYNCLAAIATTMIGLNIQPSTIQEGISKIQAIPGRMEQIHMGQKFLAIVDFAHTPYALENALSFARKLCTGRLISVFGSAGLRDRSKRRMMAEISAKLADFSIYTAEDPRTESLLDILQEMALGAEMKGGIEGKTFLRIPDRRQAIRIAVQTAKENDVVIVLGKGHEQSMCFGEVEYPWDDRTAIKAAIAELLGIEGFKMPFLPVPS